MDHCCLSDSGREVPADRRSRLNGCALLAAVGGHHRTVNDVSSLHVHGLQDVDRLPVLVDQAGEQLDRAVERARAVRYRPGSRQMAELTAAEQNYRRLRGDLRAAWKKC